MMPTLDPDLPVGLMVADHPNRAPVLEAFGIDYCCGGKLSLRWFCRRDRLDVDVVVAALTAADEAAPAAQPGPLAELLVGHMRDHHAPLRAALARVAALTAEVARMPAGASSPFPEEERLGRLQAAATAHLDHEERVLFPLVVRLERGLADEALGRRFLRGRIDALRAERGRLVAELDALPIALEGHAARGGAPARLDAAVRELRATLVGQGRAEEAGLFPRALALLEGR